MNEQIQGLINSLRDELQQYGEMLALLDQQQDLVVRRDSPELLKNLAAINGQTAVIQIARKEREALQRGVNRLAGLTDSASFTELIRLFPPDYRPLTQALVDEINHCLNRVQSRTRQNHLLLSRSLEMMQRFVSTLFPASSVTTYNQNGRVAQSTLPGHGLCEVRG